MTTANSIKEEEKKVLTASTHPIDDDLDKEYIDTRYITISNINNDSAYRKANIRGLGSKLNYIGSSITSCRTLSSNQGEIAAYFPAIIGLSANNSEFITGVKAWLSNIRVLVDDSDLKLNISFVYNTKKDYLAFKAKEDAIEALYSKTDRSNIANIQKAVKRKVTDLNTLEGEKYKVGHPVDVQSYLIYRHCLLYRDVAKDLALVHVDSTLRFYIKDESRELERQKKATQERIIAMRNFVELNSSEEKFNAVYVEILAAQAMNIGEGLLKDKNEKTTIIMDYVNSNPGKFNKLFMDKNVTTKAFIETLIVHGELLKSEYNQQISTADGSVIGANMNDTVAYFNDPKNKDIRTMYENKLKAL